ncbi:MAG: hypothetical protein M1817_006348 [Caeruleum heppii]|nr:MAG: hypothetical protein M1817_006348 [Caeruleum heppii]
MAGQSSVQQARQQASSLAGRAQNFIDSYAPPEKRQEVSKNAYSFANEQPLVAAFILTQVTLSTLPLLLFTTFTVGTLVLSTIAALAFSLFWIGVAILVLVPTLFITFSIGILVWLWLVGTWITLRYAYKTLNSAMGGVPEIKAEVRTANGLTSVSTISQDGPPKVERYYEPEKGNLSAQY